MLAKFPGWSEVIDEDGRQELDQPFPAQKVMRVLNIVLVGSSLLALISSLWQHTAAVTAATTAESLAYGFVKSGVGAAAIGLGWAVVGTSILALVLAVFVAVSVGMLDRELDS